MNFPVTLATRTACVQVPAACAQVATLMSYLFTSGVDLVADFRCAQQDWA